MQLTQHYSGRSRYGDDIQTGPHRLLVGVACRIGDHPDRFDALLDTAAEWCVLTPQVAKEMGLENEWGEGEVVLSTRFGTFRGEWMRITVRFLAIDGESLPVEATWFLSEHWPGPLVIGWKGCLERMRTGLDPYDNSFYFGD